MLAHHYAAALDNAHASGLDPGSLAEQGRIAFREAGDRAFALNALTAAARYYELAVESWPNDDPGHPEILLELARTHHLSGDERQDSSLQGARAAALAAERFELAAEADALLAQLWWYRAEPVRSSEHLERAYGLVQDLPSSPAKARVVSAGLALSDAWRRREGGNSDWVRSPRHG